MPTYEYTFTVLHGDDDLRIEEEVARIRKLLASPNADLNTSQFDGTSTPLPEILGAAEAFPFLADKRLVLVKDLLAHLARKGAGETGRKALELLASVLPTLPDWSAIVFIERVKLPDSNKILKLTSDKGGNGIAKLFAAPQDSTEWILKRAQGYDAPVERGAARALSSVTGNDLRLADNELVKLIAYVDGARPITEADVALLTPYVAEASVFEMVDALAEGRGSAAAKLAHRLLDQGQDVFAVFGMINRQFRLLLMAKEHLAGGGSRAKDALAAAIGAHPYVAEKLAAQSRAFSLEQLERIYRALHDYDVKMKTGRIEPELALDLLIATVAR